MCLKPQAVPARGKKPACFVLKKLNALCDGNPPNVQKIWPDQTEKLRSSHWGTCKFCDLDGRKLLYQLTLDCGKVRRAKWPIPSSLLQQQSCQNHRICVAGCFNCTKGDPSLVAVTLHSHITVSPATCHLVQCRPNMRVADCKNCWKAVEIWNLVKPNLSPFGIPLCKFCWTALSLGWSNLMWWQPSECPYVMATLRMSRRSG